MILSTFAQRIQLRMHRTDFERVSQSHIPDDSCEFGNTATHLLTKINRLEAPDTRE